MALVAKATEQSGQEIHKMTKRMEVDAREMKFLAEITALFLPLTALAVSSLKRPFELARILVC
jgi:hypothetical protein